MPVHLGEHIISEGQHVHTSIITPVDEVRIKEIRRKIIKSSIYSDKLIKNATEAACELIRKIEKSCNQLIEKIEKFKKLNLELLKHTLYDSNIYIEALNKIDELNFEDDPPEFNIYDQTFLIDELFGVDIEKNYCASRNDDEFLFFNDKKNGLCKLIEIIIIIIC